MRRLIPQPIQSLYHFCWALAAAIFYGFPSRQLTVIGVTGTKGKTTVTEFIAAILEESGAKVAVANGLHFKIGEHDEPNLLKMTMPGRGKLQQFLRQAVKAGCRYAILEVTSEGIRQHRHACIRFEVAALTNVQQEHVEAHGSFEAYRDAKAELFRATKDIHVINADDPNAGYFTQFPAKTIVQYSIRDASRLALKPKLPGAFNLMNAALAATVAETLDVTPEIIQKAVAAFEGVPGRMQFVQREPFAVIVDYAHTPDSLEAAYRTIHEELKPARMICVLGAAGDRDKWKRPVMGDIAAKYCDEIVLTNEDPYDEDPNRILSEIKSGIAKSDFFISHLHVVPDRKEAIEKAISLAQSGDAVIITGKGAERFIVVGKKKIPWSETDIVKAALGHE